MWDYWFQHFTPQYSGLPGLGSIEKIYNQVDVGGEPAVGMWLFWHASRCSLACSQCYPQKRARHAECMVVVAFISYAMAPQSTRKAAQEVLHTGSLS